MKKIKFYGMELNIFFFFAIIIFEWVSQNSYLFIKEEVVMGSLIVLIVLMYIVYRLTK